MSWSSPSWYAKRRDWETRTAVRARLSVVASLATLDATAEAKTFAEVLVRTAAVPQAAIPDAAHIAVAVGGLVRKLAKMAHAPFEFYVVAEAAGDLGQRIFLASFSWQAVGG